MDGDSRSHVVDQSFSVGVRLYLITMVEVGRIEFTTEEGGILYSKSVIGTTVKPKSNSNI